MSNVMYPVECGITHQHVRRMGTKYTCEIHKIVCKYTSFFHNTPRDFPHNTIRISSIGLHSRLDTVTFNLNTIKPQEQSIN